MYSDQEFRIEEKSVSAVRSSKLDMWEPRREMTLVQARHRSSLVGMLRMLFMAGAAISAGCLVGPIVGNTLFSSNALAVGAVSGVTMLNPRFTGLDSSGKAYTLIAETARRRINDIQVVDLDHPIMEDGFGSEMRAKTGTFNREKQVLTLDGKVEITNAEGYYFLSQNAVIDIRMNTIVGVTPLIGEGPIGKMRADQYEVSDNGKKALLTGNVWTRIEDTTEIKDDNK